MDPIVARNEQETVSLNKKRILNVIKKLKEAYLPDEHPSSGRKDFIGTNDQNKNQPYVIPVGSGDQIVPVVSNACERTTKNAYGSDSADEKLPNSLTRMQKSSYFK